MSSEHLIDLRTGKEYPLQDQVTIGRDPGNSLVLDDASIAPRHVQVRRYGQKWMVLDCGAQEGVYVDHQRLPPLGLAALSNGSTLTLGSLSFRFSDGSAPDDPAVRPASSPGSAPAKTPVAPPVAPPHVPAAEPGERAKRAPSFRKPLIVLAVAIVLFLGWCLIQHSAGVRAMDAERYADAIASFGRDPLFSRGKKQEALLMAGADAHARGAYNEAEDYYLSAGDAGRDAWCDVICDHAAALIDMDQVSGAIAVLDQLPEDHAQRRSDVLYDGALSRLASGHADTAAALLEPISDETRAKEQLGVIQLAQAERALESGAIETAISIAEDIENTRYADAAGFLAQAYHALGNSQVAKGDLEAALKSFRNCPGDPVAQTNASILTLLESRRYTWAVQAADTAVREASTDVPWDGWKELILQACSSQEETRDTDTLLDVTYARRFVSGDLGDNFADEGSAFRQAFPKGTDMVDKTYGTRAPDLETVYGLCGAAPAGKVLILCKTVDYPDKSPNYGYVYNLMEQMPLHFYPASLSEVEYILLLSYDYTKYGTYEGGSAALQENGRVQLIRVSDRRTIYQSPTVAGSPPPYWMSSLLLVWGWGSGNAPDLTAQAISAFSYIK